MKSLFPFPLFAALLFGSIFQHTAKGGEYFPSKQAGLHGGLIVQLGANDATSAANLSLSGRYLVHVLDTNAEEVESARSHIREYGRYGMAWAEHANNKDRLPYAENIVNMIVVESYTVPIEELTRVLVPGGTIVSLNSSVLSKKQIAAARFESMTTDGSTLIAKKPWPLAMDDWSHPRHAANGNAVSLDTLVGPPERVRWIAAATSEVEGMVTSGGRNFYGGMLSRDSFNGLRLWHRDLKQGTEANAVGFTLPKLTTDSVRPVASKRLVFGVLKDRPVAFDAATGEVAIEFGDIANPNSMIHDEKQVILSDDKSVRAFDIETGKELWQIESSAPRNVVTDGKWVSFLQGQVRRGEKTEAVVVASTTGKVAWRRSDFPWLSRTARTVMAGGQLVFEVSTLSDHDADNGIHVVAVDTGKHSWSKNFPPGMNHKRQARAMFLKGDLWILHGGKVNTDDKEKLTREKVQVSALNPQTGEVRVTLPAGLAHCFPPVATPKFMFAGELDMTNLESGEVIANRITKANCSRENGWVPANGLVYTTPKHCTCWPMLRGFVAMAPAPKKDAIYNKPVEEIEFLLEQGPAKVDPKAASPQAGDWPLYRHNAWRSAGTSSAGPADLTVKWRLELDEHAKEPAGEVGPIEHDWRDSPVVKGPLSAPTIANGIAYITRPNKHELVAVDTDSGEVRWRFTANGRLDTPPAIHRGLCLFGTAMGWVYALRADDGELVWRMRAAPTDERIVAYGQVESPWPVPGAVLVVDDIAYFAAGRQPLADGGIFVFAVNPLNGQRHWVTRIDSVPQKGFYENSGLEFDPFDILHAEDDSIAMSRWILSPDGKDVSVDKWNAFAKLNTGAGEVWIPRGSWTYGARHQHRFAGEASRRPLVAFRDDNVFSSLNGGTDIFRRDFDLDKGEKFNSKWITGWEAASTARKKGTPYRSYRIAEGAKWTSNPFIESDTETKEVNHTAQKYNRIHAMALGKDQLYAVHQDGRLKVLSTTTGEVVNSAVVPTPSWDGIAIAENCLFLTTQEGELICLGK